MYTIYSKPACSQCVMAKNMLSSKGIEYKEVHLDVGQPKSPDQEYISRDALLDLIPNAKTMPQIFQDEKYVGGFQELRNLMA